MRQMTIYEPNDVVWINVKRMKFEYIGPAKVIKISSVDTPGIEWRSDHFKISPWEDSQKKKREKNCTTTTTTTTTNNNIYVTYLMVLPIEEKTEITVEDIEIEYFVE
jgi:hypothetical protein